MLSSPAPDLGPWPLLGYTTSPLDRAAHLRASAAELAEKPDARAYLIGGEFVAARLGAAGLDPLFDLAHARALGGAEPLFLGLHDGAPRFALSFPAGQRDAMVADGLVVDGLRGVAVAGQLAPGDLSAIACGKALAAWHGRHRFCSNCGAPSRVDDGGWRRDCPACGGQHFPRTDPVVIMLTARGDQCLLGRQPQFAPGMWSCLAGFVEPGETLEDAVRREVLEEAGIATGPVSYFAAQPWPFPMSLMIGCLAEATSEAITIDPKELEAARWFSRGEVALMLSRSHPDGLFNPPPNAIAHHLLRAFVEGARAGGR